MTVVVDRRSDIDLEVYRRVALAGERVEVGPEAVGQMAATRAAFLDLIDSDPDVVVYGTTSGAGDRAKFQLEPAEREDHGRRLLGMSPSWGDPLPERVVRGIVLARLATWVDGHAAVRPELARQVAAMLDGDRLPPVPGRGNGGSGEIIALKQLFSPLAERFGTEIKEPMALINGSPCSAALVADAALFARARCRLAYQVFALSSEAMLAPHDSVDEALEELWGDPHETTALRELRGLLDGGHLQRRSYQAPVSWRILPRMLGRAERATARAEEAAVVSLRAVSDNPVYLPPDEAHPRGRAISTGGYHNAMAYPALDELAATWADLAQLCERQTERLLASIEQGNPEGYPVALYMVQAGWAEDARAAAQTTLIGLGGLGQNDTPAPTFFAWAREAEAARCLEAALAIVAVLASEWLAYDGRGVPPALGGLLAEVRRHVPPRSDGKVAGSAMESLHDSFASAVARLEVSWRGE